MTSETEHKKRSVGGSRLREEWRQVFLLATMYFVQGLPMGLITGALPFLLQPRFSYSDLATISLASYPYSLKLLWSPIVDSMYVESFGRRKSWIVPVQAIVGLMFLFWVPGFMSEDSAASLAWKSFLIVFFVATQDIAVDGWGLTLLSPANVSHAGTCQSVGLSLGYFISFTVFLGLREYGYVTFEAFALFIGVANIALSVVLMFVRECNGADSLGLRSTYTAMWKLLKLPSIRRLCAVLLISKVAFSAADSLNSLKLIEKGFKMTDMASLVLLEFPFEFAFSIYAGRFASSDPNKPLRPWIIGYGLRLVSAAAGFMLVKWYPVPVYVLFASLLMYALPTEFMFVSQGAFFAKISDASIGGTYLTFLNTVSNLGGTWPKYFTLWLADYLTVKFCIESADGLAPPECTNIHDGFNVISIICLSFGVLLYIFLVRRSLSKIQALGSSAWKLSL
eukprot:ANDGO_05465.mRNA.1 Uncharacterized protein C21B10.09